MKKQIKHLSPHQNGKVFGILMAVSTLPFLLLMMLMTSFTMPDNAEGIPTFFLFVAPFMYLILGYISVAIACVIYNFIQKYIGGIEFEIADSSE